MAVLQSPRHTYMPRGELGMENESQIIETYRFGNSTVHIASDFIRRNDGEIEMILDELNRIGWAVVEKLAAKGIGEGEVWNREMED